MGIVMAGLWIHVEYTRMKNDSNILIEYYYFL